jgi:hypothetical protein
MNVQPGDMARVVAPYCEAGRGAIVSVLRPMLGAETFGTSSYAFQPDSWVVQGWVRDESGFPQGPQLVIFDNCLRRVDPFTGAEGDQVSQQQPEGSAAA